jgi:hypothetical protein
VKREVAEMLKGRILVGHALHNDLKVLEAGRPGNFGLQALPCVFYTLMPSGSRSVIIVF